MARHTVRNGLEGRNDVDRKHIGLLQCGHWFREGWPANLPEPEPGYLRICADPEHYPNKFPAVYFPESEKFLTFLALDPVRSVSRWEDTFAEWSSLRTAPLGTLPDIRRELAACWRAALTSVALDRPSDLAGLKVEEAERP